MQQVRFGVITVGTIFEVRVEKNGRGEIVRRFFFDQFGVRAKPPESGSVLELVNSPEIPDSHRFWKFRTADWRLYPQKPESLNARVADIGELQGPFRLHALPVF